MQVLIEVQNLEKTYRNGKKAVDSVTFSVNRGELFGFLGPNGAGKTTTIKILVTLLRKSSGVARVAGLDVDESPEAVRRLIGYAAQFVGVDGDLTTRENLTLLGRLFKLSARVARRRADDLLEVFGLAAVADERVQSLSGGMRRRLDLAQALVHEPTLVFLDEPTTGLDSQTRRAFWTYIKRLNNQGSTIFLTTQYLEEADRLCGRIVVIDQGRVVADGTPGALKRGISDEVIRITFATGSAGVERAVRQIRELPGVTTVRIDADCLVAGVDSPGMRLAEIVRVLNQHRVHAEAIEITGPTLDDVFSSYTGQAVGIGERERLR